jgi:hypothetical protein
MLLWQRYLLTGKVTSRSELRRGYLQQPAVGGFWSRKSADGMRSMK